MTAFLFYILKVIVCSALFAGCYWCVLRNGRFYHWNRFYIVTSVTLSITVPLLNLPLSTSYKVIPAATVYVAQFVTVSSEVATVSLQPETSPFSWTGIGVMFCLSIVFFLLVKEVISFVRILRLKRRSERIRLPEAVLYCTDDAAAPFTFFRTIFWKKGISIDSGEGRCIFRHELAHVRLGHSWDKALMQLVCCMFWMNPFFMLFRRELELVHEFAADSESSAEELSSMLLCTLYPSYYRDFTSRFFQSSIKRRIFMISKNKTTTMSMLRKMSILPVALVAMYLFACKSGDILTQTEMTPTMAETDAESKTVSESSNLNAEETILFAKVEEKPLFNEKEAETAFREWVNSKIVYPPVAQEKGITGRVFVEFAIDKDGSVTDVKLLRGVDPLLDGETLRVISSSPNWTPGKHEGKPVKVLYQFQTIFRSNNEPPSLAQSNTVCEGDEVLVFYSEVEESPLFNGKSASEGFREYLNLRVVYPKEAMEKGISGRVNVEFIIEKDGSVSNARVIRGVDPLLDSELLRIVTSSPKWTPGKQGGNTVRVRQHFGFDFKSNN